MVAGADQTAEGTFEDGQYTVHVLEEPTVLYRVGKQGRKLGQYFTREKPSSVADVRGQFALKDDWGVEGVSLREVFAPAISTVHQLTAPAGTVVYEGRAAPLGQFMPTADALAAEVFSGGGHQVLIVRPWELPGAAEAEGCWGHQACKLRPGNLWDLLCYEPTPLCVAASSLPTDAEAIKAASREELMEPAGRFGLTPLHHAVAAGSLPAAELLISCGVETGRPNHMGLTPILLAAIRGDPRMVGLIGKKPGNGVNMVELMYGRSPLAFAARAGDLPTVEALLKVPGIMTYSPAKDNSTALWSELPPAPAAAPLPASAALPTGHSHTFVRWSGCQGGVPARPHQRGGSAATGQGEPRRLNFPISNRSDLCAVRAANVDYHGARYT